MQELSQIAEGEPFIPSVTTVDIAFNNRLTNLDAFSRVHNLISVSILNCQALTSLEGLEAASHSLE